LVINDIEDMNIETSHIFPMIHL